MRWKVKDRALMTRCMETPIKNPVDVVVLRTDCGGGHPIKVTDKDENVFYCAATDLMEPTGKSKPAPTSPERSAFHAAELSRGSAPLSRNAPGSRSM